MSETVGEGRPHRSTLVMGLVVVENLNMHEGKKV